MCAWKCWILPFWLGRPLTGCSIRRRRKTSNAELYHLVQDTPCFCRSDGHGACLDQSGRQCDQLRTDRNGQVRFISAFLIDDVYVKVSDTGFGIEDHMPRIFQPLLSCRHDRFWMYGGTGLGLSIAKELVEFCNGKINVSSVLGKGTEFTVMIPAARRFS